MMNYMGSWGPILDTVEVIAAKRMAKWTVGLWLLTLPPGSVSGS